MSNIKPIKQTMNKDIPKVFTLDLSDVPIYNQANIVSSTACSVATLYAFEQSKQKNTIPSKLEEYTKRNN